MNLAFRPDKSNFHVGSRVQIQPQSLDNHPKYLAYAYGEIKEINGAEVSVLLDEPNNQAYKSHITQVPVSCLTLVGAESKLQELEQVPNGTSELHDSQPILNIDPEFQNLIPPLSDEEKFLLEAQLKESGCLSPLMVWKGKGILLDGHNRYQLCQKLQIPYNIAEVELASRDAAICWIANNQLGRRNMTPETASYLRGKRYLSLKGNREDNLKQNLPNGNSCRSAEEDSSQDLPDGDNPIAIDTAKALAEKYKVGERTIRNDAKYTQAVDTLALTFGEPVKHSILTRADKFPKKDVLELASAASTQEKEHVQKMLDNKLNKSDIVDQIKNKQRVPNPHHKGEVCQIISKGDPELKAFGGAWCIIVQVNPHSCGIKTWKEEFPTVKPENLETIYGVCEQKAAENCDRILKLFQKVHEDYEPTYMAILEALSKVRDPSKFTPRQEYLLTILEQEYKLLPCASS
ncbi:hypothetical protein DSM106972_047020 [Dulcicalothrix desertica PCC 7102]|uniref:ParB/Sulfiredoxin domain-containing protein n=1 Tax=Dulcicalothrix desertica PCC 7102 TaxID=232991 RepID=A0A433VCI7_9CYAN|nr:hypothetical protein [Dulcicalothrix desertica]RUT03788.1 hypothetical protein DSM106972_047020 [Dulcicalothrix desertica PCC 7102]TWH43805.1 hypothetical protein CAL7102_07549 [Dulcicalothrix desertica PCC 7102]